MDTYMITVTLLGLAFFGAAWLPHLVKGRPLSFPAIYILIGWVIFSAPLGLRLPNPLESGVFTERFTEILVIISLTGAGLKLAKPIGMHRWNTTWRLLAILMPLTVLAAALLGWGWLGLAPASAVLLGAVLAPTDPVLASDVQVGPPGKGREDNVRFSLTSEAGLNDGLAFPFTNLAIALALSAGASTSEALQGWFLEDVLLKLGVGGAAGLVVGRVLAYLIFRADITRQIAREQQGFAVLAITFLTYGLTELAHGYGFLAVFIAAYSIRQYERDHQYHEVLHDFAESLERILMSLVLILFGGLLALGLMRSLDWPMALFAVALVFILRPLLGMLSLWGTRLTLEEMAVTSFFGIRGIGSIYYLVYALNHASFPQSEELWATVSFTIVLSIVVHGVSASLVMKRLDERLYRAGRDD